MPTDLVARVNLDLGYAPFVETLLYVLADCRAAGDDFYVTWLFRDPSESDSLVKSGAQAAPGLESPHNFGIAADVCHDADLGKAGLQPDWNGAGPAYARFGRIAKLHGLVWGGDFHKPDFDHVNIAGYSSAAELAPLKAAWLASADSVPDRLRRCWALIDSR